MPGPLLAVDAPSLMFRAWYALPDTIRSEQGMPVNALLGSTNLMLWVVERYDPRAVVLCFGAEAAHYRVEAYAGYHADREDPPDGLGAQFQLAPVFFESLGWQLAVTEDLEPDDLLGSLAAVEAKAGGRTLILTGDRDMYQCAGDSCLVLYVKTGTQGAEEVDSDEVERRYGVRPEQVPDFIALRGDPSDGLPGAKGIGEKTAADLLQRHGSLEAAIAAADGEKPRVAAALRDQAEELRSFQDIATLRIVDLERPPDRPTDREGGADAARRLGMNRLAQRLEDH